MFETDIAMDRFIDELRHQESLLGNRVDALHDLFDLDRPEGFSPASSITTGLLAEHLHSLPVELRSRLADRLDIEGLDDADAVALLHERAQTLLMSFSTFSGLHTAQQTTSMDAMPAAAADWVHEVYSDLRDCNSLLSQLRTGTFDADTAVFEDLAQEASDRAYANALQRMQEVDDDEASDGAEEAVPHLVLESYGRAGRTGLANTTRRYLRVPGAKEYVGFLELEKSLLHCCDERLRDQMRAHLTAEGLDVAGSLDAQEPRAFHPWATYPLEGYVRLVAAYEEVGRFYFSDRRLVVVDDCLRDTAENVLRRLGVVAPDEAVDRAYRSMGYDGSIIWDPPPNWPQTPAQRRDHERVQAFMREAQAPVGKLTKTMKSAWKSAKKAIKQGDPQAWPLVCAAVAETGWHRYFIADEAGVFENKHIPDGCFVVAEDGRVLVNQETWGLFQGDREGSLSNDILDVPSGIHWLTQDQLDALSFAALPPVMTRELNQEWERVGHLLAAQDVEAARAQATLAAQACGWERYEPASLRVQSFSFRLSSDADGEEFEGAGDTEDEDDEEAIFGFEATMTLGGDSRFFSCPVVPSGYCYVEHAGYERRGEWRRLRSKLVVTHPDGIRALRARADVEALNSALERAAEGLYQVDELIHLAAQAATPVVPTLKHTVKPLPRTQLPVEIGLLDRSDSSDHGDDSDDRDEYDDDESGGEPDFWYWDSFEPAGIDQDGPDLSRLSEQLDHVWPAQADDLCHLLLQRAGGHAPSCFALRAKTLFPELERSASLPELEGTIYSRFGTWHHGGPVAALTFGRMRRHAAWQVQAMAQCPICMARFRTDQLDARNVSVLGADWFCGDCAGQASWGVSLSDPAQATQAMRLFFSVSGLPPRANWRDLPLPDELDDQQRVWAVVRAMAMPDKDSVQVMGGWRKLAREL
ncbi:hypothetical protein [Kineosporia babensis]|uniref:Uncharacterized protein n=1 Tax=Kineosporia babensis TaxID=499548 RepID=A0A9X1T4P2_9ACTN|nr:hypothetical protein [Kineosporia babensis]MCD5316858.1 hypothetical protein [Kineosporia babensis]